MNPTHTPQPLTHSVSGSFSGFGNRHRFAMFRDPNPDPSPSPSPEPAPLTAESAIPETLHKALGLGNEITTFGGLGKALKDTQTALLNPKAPETYDLTKAREVHGSPDDDFSDIVGAAREAGLSQSRFDKFVAKMGEAMKTENESWKTEAAKVLGDTKLEALQQQFGTLSGTEGVSLDNINPAVLGALKSVLERASSSGLKPPAAPGGPQLPDIDARFRLEVDGKPYGVDLSGDLDARMKSLGDFYNQRVEVTAKDGTKTSPLLRDVEPAEFKRIYREALREHGAKEVH